MDGAVMDLSVEGAETSRGVSAQQLPLTFVSAGETVKVIKVRGKNDLTHHLGNLGFVEAAEVKVIAGVQGDLVVQVKGAQVAISRQAANHIVTTAARKLFFGIVRRDFRAGSGLRRVVACADTYKAKVIRSRRKEQVWRKNR